MPWHNLSEFIPWILAIFFVLFLIACCSWFYRCIQKCDDQCPGILPDRQPYNPNLPMTPFQNSRNTREGTTTRGPGRLTCRSAPNDSNESSGSCFMSSSSASNVVHYHGLKAPPYVSFSDRLPPPSYEEACGSGASSVVNNNAEQSPTTSAENAENTQTDVAIETVSNVGINDDSTSVSNANTNTTDVANFADESVAIDNPQDEPLIIDDCDDDDDVVIDVVIETYSPLGNTSGEATQSDSHEVYR